MIDKLFETWNGIIKIFDYGYRGTLVEKLKTKFKAVFDVIERTELYTFKILPRVGLWKEPLHGLTLIGVIHKITNV